MYHTIVLLTMVGRLRYFESTESGSTLSPMMYGTGASRNPLCEAGRMGTKTWGQEKGNTRAVAQLEHSISRS